MTADPVKPQSEAMLRGGMPPIPPLIEQDGAAGERKWCGASGASNTEFEWIKLEV